MFGGVLTITGDEYTKSIINIEDSIFYFEENKIYHDNYGEILNDFYNTGKLEIFRNKISLDGGISDSAKKDNELEGELNISYSKIFTKEDRGVIIRQKDINLKESSINFIIGINDINTGYPKIIANKISGDVIIKLGLSSPLSELVNKCNNFSITEYPIMFADTIDANIRLYKSESEEMNNTSIKFEIYKNNLHNKEVLTLGITKNQGFIPKPVNIKEVFNGISELFPIFALIMENKNEEE